MGRKEGVSRYSFEKFLTRSPEKVLTGILQCFTHFGYRNGLRIGGGEAGRDYQNISSESFCRTMSKQFVGESVGVSIISAIEKVYKKEWEGRREYQDIRSRSF